MPINDRLKELLSVNQNKRLAEEKARENRRDNPKILRHTTYQGDRKIQQLGDEIIENGVVLNNQAVEIGDVMLPLAQGNVLRRVDNTNGGELLGSAYRNAKEEDLDINGNQFSGSGVPTIPTGGGGGIGNGGSGGKLPTKSPAPSGCQQPPPTCVWSPDSSPPQGWQSYGSVTLDSGTLNLYCLSGTPVSRDLGCDFLAVYAWKVNYTYHDPFNGCATRFVSFFMGLANGTESSGIGDLWTSPTIVWTQADVGGTACPGGRRIEIRRNGIIWVAAPPFSPVSGMSFTYEFFALRHN
jgi:hypothetical protein